MVIGGVAWLWGVSLIIIAATGILVSAVLFGIGKSADDREKLGLIKGFIRLLKKSGEITYEERRAVKTQRFGLVGIAIVGVFALFTIVFAATSAPQFCNMCHAMKADVTAWEESSHAQVTCFACHLKPGLANYVQGHIVDAVKSAVAWISGSYEMPINVESKLSEELNSNGCTTCHTLKNVVPSPGVKINHKAHTDRGIGCATCHNRVGHANMKGFVDAVSMEGCTRCHGFAKEDTAPGKCELCHTPSFNLIPTDHKPANWKPHEHSVQAKVALKKVKPASENKEGEKAAAEGGESKPPLPLHNGKASCYQCHDEAKFCEGCHQLPMPHPANFTNASIHGKLGTEKPQVCANCHAKQGGQNFCTACHHKGFDPNVAWAGPKGTPQTHPAVARKTGAEGCLRCHDERYCSSCHTQGQPNMQYMYKQH